MGNRTPILCLEGTNFTIKLYPRYSNWCVEQASNLFEPAYETGAIANTAPDAWCLHGESNSRPLITKQPFYH